MDVTGKTVALYTNIDEKSFTLERNGLDAGVYLIQVKTDIGSATSRLIFR